MVDWTCGDRLGIHVSVPTGMCMHRSIQLYSGVRRGGGRKVGLGPLAMGPWSTDSGWDDLLPLALSGTMSPLRVLSRTPLQALMHVVESSDGLSFVYYPEV